MISRKTFTLVGVCLVFVAIIIGVISTKQSFVFSAIQKNQSFNYGSISEVNKNQESPSKKAVKFTHDQTFGGVYFVGDVMLARHVEELMTRYDFRYPYRYLDFTTADFALVGNFEASIPKKHEKTPNFAFSFSVDKNSLPALKEAGFTHMSLANNHAFDNGHDGLINAEKVLSENKIETLGRPNSIGTSTVSFINTDFGRVGVLAMETLSGDYAEDELREVLQWTASRSDLLLVYIHWGAEYSLNQDQNQRELATKMSLWGVDVIVGHHPHVTQGIEKINNTLVVYSLGNFIFDQYFSTDVRQGLMVEIKKEGTEVRLNLLPITTENTLAQPQLMPEENKKVFLQNLAKRSSKDLQLEILEGQLTLISGLATSTKTAIMAR